MVTNNALHLTKDSATNCRISGAKSEDHKEKNSQMAFALWLLLQTLKRISACTERSSG